jgi:CRISPR/Cas system-associated exonuclease Cas4 (RecB family)
MYLLEIPHGLLLYENKNDHKKLLIPVEMTDVNRQKIEKVVEWMRRVYRAYQEDKLPKRPYRKNSKECKSCPVFDWCKQQPEGDITLEPLEFDVG